MTTCASRWAKPSASARPMPRLPPETRTTCSATENRGSCCNGSSCERREGSECVKEGKDVSGLFPSSKPVQRRGKDPSTFFTHHLRLHRRRTPQQIAPQRLWIGAHYRFYIRFDDVPGAQPDLALELRSAPACVAEEETLDAVRLLPEEAPEQRAVRAEVHIADHWDGMLCVCSPAKQEHQPAGLHRAAEEERISPLLELRLVREPFLQGELCGPVENYTDRTTVFWEDDEHDALRKIGVLQLWLRDEKDRRRHGLGSATGHPTE